MISIFDKVLQSLQQASRHNSSVMVKPEVILWPDPERQWEAVIPILQEKINSLLIFGAYEPDRKQGPAIWLKCMVARSLPEAAWPETETPILYLPGISKQDFKNITAAGLLLQPLMEYQYTGVIWLHENGKEWTVPAFVQNAQAGLGLKMSQDNATKDALLTALPGIFEDRDTLYNKVFVDEEFLLSTVFPDITLSILKWMMEPEGFMNSLSKDMRSTFINLCKSRFEFEPDYKNIREIALKLGAQKNAWLTVWQYYANAPRKFQKIPELLRLAKPDDLGTGMFALPEHSWPQINEEKEEKLRQDFMHINKNKSADAYAYLVKLRQANQSRKHTVWYELAQARLVEALEYLTEMAQYCAKPYPSGSIGELAAYYIGEGYKADQFMRKALAAVTTENHREAVTNVITYCYKPWLEKITMKFQGLLQEKSGAIMAAHHVQEDAEFILFVDALRYELAVEFADRLQATGYEVNISEAWSALPSLTPTAKPFVSPLAGLVSVESECHEFRPQLNSGKDLQTAAFREALTQVDFTYASTVAEIDVTKKTWMEIGDIDTKGHQEQALMVRRVDELFRTVMETIEAAMAKGVKQIKIVTDHGWLLLPGGLPKTELSKHLAETRWGRCALIKEGATTELLHLPWRWNPSVFVAYAPGISFFKKNEAYAHGGLSLQECLIPQMQIRPMKGMVLSGKIAAIKWNNQRCVIELDGVEDGYRVDVRTKATDEATSIVLSAVDKKTVKDNKCSLAVDDESEGSAAWIVLMTSQGVIVDKQMTSVGQ